MSNSGFEIGMGITPILKKDMELEHQRQPVVAEEQTALIEWRLQRQRICLPQTSPTSVRSTVLVSTAATTTSCIRLWVSRSVYSTAPPHRGLTKIRWQLQKALCDCRPRQNGKVNIEDGGDRYIAGQATPKMTLGSNISFRYKDFDISQMNGAFGHKIYNGTSLTYMNMSSSPTTT